MYYARDLPRVLEWLKRERIVPMTLGDDFLISVQKEVQPYLNAISFSEFSALYGMKITGADKGPIKQPFCTESPVFLKRVCYYSKPIGRWVGALDKDAIAEGMCWMRKDSPSTEELFELFDHALMEYSLWGPDVYAVEVLRVIEAARITTGRNYVPLNWQQALRAVDNIVCAGPSSKF